MTPGSLLHFPRLRRGRFVNRPNRFLVRCKWRDGTRITAHLPNPGRLHELLLPNVTLTLAPKAKTSTRHADRRTNYTVVAVERDGAPVFLHTHLTNTVARRLIEKDHVPGLETATILRAEVPLGRSRFDFLLEQNGKEVYLEVKSCTLFGNGTAMFPDAVTERGKRHLEELAALRKKGIPVGVLFVIHTPTAKWFMPDFHTDLAFSRTFLSLRNIVPFYPVTVSWTKDLRLNGVGLAEIPWDYLEKEIEDRGSYLILMRLPRRRRIEVGALGPLSFDRGWVVYVGSAKKNLTARINRHLRTRKKQHWHIDYLRPVAGEVTALPIRSSRDEECDIAKALAEILTPTQKGFGCSDCTCPTHLFWSTENPLDSKNFHDVLQRARGVRRESEY